MISIILAGGENRRLPFIKSMVTVDGIPVIERILEVHKRLFEKIIISTNMPEMYFRYGLSMAGDIVNERGPLTGILSAMMSHEDESFFVMASDMPFPNESLIRYIISVDCGADAVIPVYQGEPQPLLGIYNRRLIRQMYSSIAQKKKSMRRFVSEIDTHFIDEEIKNIDPEGRSFININTINDLNKIQGGNICSDSASRN